MREPRVLRIERDEASALQGGGLGVPDRVLDGALAIRITHAAGVGHDPVVGEHRGVDRVQLRGVEVGPDHPFLEVVEHDVTRTAQRPERLLVQPRPHLLVGLPHHLAEALARVLERHHEEIRPAILARGDQRQRPLPVVELQRHHEQIRPPVLAAPMQRQRSLSVVDLRLLP